MSLTLTFLRCVVIDPDGLRDEIPSNSYLEACIRLYIIGDYFCYDSLISTSLEQLKTRCRHHMSTSAHVSAASRGLPFMTDLEAAIRLAWTPGKSTKDVQDELLMVCTSFNHTCTNFLVWGNCSMKFRCLWCNSSKAFLASLLSRAQCASLFATSAAQGSRSPGIIPTTWPRESSFSLTQTTKCSLWMALYFARTAPS